LTLAIGLFSRFVSLTALRAEFPVLERLAYLNAGTDGPLPARAVQASLLELERERDAGRTRTHFERRGELAATLRRHYARALGAREQDVALTTCTTEGIAHVLAGMPLGEGDEIVTSDEEHPGLLGPLGALRQLRGVRVREVPFDQVAEAVDARTRLVACSHVSWATGSFAPRELADAEVPVLLDGAQGAGAVEVDVAALGCAAYAAAGQKWMCGPDCTGMLYVRPSLRERLAITRRGYANLEEPNAGLDATPHDDARALDALSLNGETLACAVAAAEVLDTAQWPAVHERARSLAGRLIEQLARLGREPASRGGGTLVSFPSPDPEGERLRLAEQGVVVRDIPGRPWLRASVGAWNDEDDLDRLLGALDR
jgi:selenocysteine lyase/cysteine desulfurase